VPAIRCDRRRRVMLMLSSTRRERDSRQGRSGSVGIRGTAAINTASLFMVAVPGISEARSDRFEPLALPASRARILETTRPLPFPHTLAPYMVMPC